ncbi:MAG: putative Mariner Mos1 transposase [Streblomastix strix]|uniref:Putative Mariner Mos1 transposase n=1 Tax=Streblomastix strix TaxID=222440 RepID=A0A5J4X7U5_9EUKA|nr:MAG: putative Mariner Mos1 transposase [Streblomastix strix]
MKSLTPAQLHKLEIRSVVKNYWMLNKSTVEAFDALATTYPLNHPTDRTVRNLYARYESGNIAIVDAPRQGRPAIADLTDQIKTILAAEPESSASYMAESTGHSEGTILQRLRDVMGYVFLKNRWVAHELSQEQKDNRVIYAGQLHEWLTFAKRNNYEFIITGDESWILYSYPNAGKWAPKGTLRYEHEKTTVATSKTMLTVMFSGKRFWLKDFLPHGITMNSHVFIDRILGPTMDAIDDEYPDIDTEVILRIDNSPVHNSKISKNYVKDTILHRVDNPAYSLDLAPSDFWLFGDLKRSMKGQRFQEQEQLENFVKGWLAGQSEAKLKSVFDEWRDRCYAVAFGDGSYIF